MRNTGEGMEAEEGSIKGLFRYEDRKNFHFQHKKREGGCQGCGVMLE